MIQQLSLLAFLEPRMLDGDSTSSRVQQCCLSLEERKEFCIISFEVLGDIMKCFHDGHQIE